MPIGISALPLSSQIGLTAPDLETAPLRSAVQ